jgi:hypothetical protein
VPAGEEVIPTLKAIAAWNTLFDAAAGDAMKFAETLAEFVKTCEASGNLEAQLAAKAIRFRIIMWPTGPPPARWGS